MRSNVPLECWLDGGIKTLADLRAAKEWAAGVLWKEIIESNQPIGGGSSCSESHMSDYEEEWMACEHVPPRRFSSLRF